MTTTATALLLDLDSCCEWKVAMGERERERKEEVIRRERERGREEGGGLETLENGGH